MLKRFVHVHVFKIYIFRSSADVNLHPKFFLYVVTVEKYKKYNYPTIRYAEWIYQLACYIIMDTRQTFFETSKQIMQTLITITMVLINPIAKYPFHYNFMTRAREHINSYIRDKIIKLWEFSCVCRLRFIFRNRFRRKYLNPNHCKINCWYIIKSSHNWGLLKYSDKRWNPDVWWQKA